MKSLKTILIIDPIRLWKNLLKMIPHQALLKIVRNDDQHFRYTRYNDLQSTSHARIISRAIKSSCYY